MNLFLGFSGTAILISCQLYHVIYHPEWTQAEALHHQWPFFVVAILLVLPLVGTPRAEYNGANISTPEKDHDTSTRTPRTNQHSTPDETN